MAFIRVQAQRPRIKNMRYLDPPKRKISCAKVTQFPRNAEMAVHEQVGIDAKETKIISRVFFIFFSKLKLVQQWKREVGAFIAMDMPCSLSNRTIFGGSAARQAAGRDYRENMYIYLTIFQ